MFNFKVEQHYSTNNPDKEHETYARLDSDGVSYHLYIHTGPLSVEINTYIVHPVRGGIIRRDRQTLGAPLFNWGDYSKFYAGAK